MSKNVAVFVDVANIFYAAKSAGVDIDYVTLLKSATAGRDFVRAYAYTGLDPDNENQRNFHQFLARHQYKVVSKDIRKYGDGKVKANLDIELVVDLMKTARNLDIAVIVSGDGDFASAIRAVQEMGVRVEVISFRGNTSSDLIEVADLFTDITHIAKVDKGSTRSGRRVAEDDDEDLSMTEVPEKQSEGTGRGRGRGRGRGGRYERDEAPVAARASSRPSSRLPVEAPAAGGGLVALPGEKLSRAAASAAAGEEPELDEEAAIAADGELGDVDAEGRRRRRRRGGRGRGRGRRDELGTVEAGEGGEIDEADLEAAEVFVDDAQEAAEAEPDEVDEADEEDEAVAAASTAAAPTRSRPTRGGRTSSGEFATPFDDLDALSAPRAPRSTPFGSVWDTQLGGPPARPAASGSAPLPLDEEDLEEPEIPEYLLAERRQGNRGGGGNTRGGRGGGRQGAYAAAIERERYGGGRSGGGSGINRYGESRGGNRTGGGGGGGGGGNRGGQAPRGNRNDRPAERYDRAPRQASPSGSAEPWSEVPPELEEMLRAQMAQGRPATSVEQTPRADVSDDAAPKRRTTRKAPAATTEAPPADVAETAGAEAPAAAPKRRTTRTSTAATAEAADTGAAEAPAEAAAPKRRTTRKASTDATPASTPAPAEAAEAPAEAAAPKRRTTRKASTADATEAPAEATAPKRRTTRKASTDATPAEG